MQQSPVPLQPARPTLEEETKFLVYVEYPKHNINHGQHSLKTAVSTVSYKYGGMARLDVPAAPPLLRVRLL